MPLSVDTYRAEVADAVLAAGAVLVNDYTGFFDPELPDVAARHGAGLVCAHYRGAPRSNPSRSYAVSVERGRGRPARAPRAGACRRRRAGVAARRPVLRLRQGHRERPRAARSPCRVCARSGAPLLAACSHKEFTADATGLEEHDLRGTLAAAVLCARAGADVLRLHDVGEIVPALRLADAVRAAEERLAVRVLVTSDTHVGAARRPSLPAALLEHAETADAILHGGDLTDPEILIELGAYAPVSAMRGNCDPLVPGLPERRIVELAGDADRDGPRPRAGAGTARPAARAGSRTAASSIFGHTHLPVCEDDHGLLLLNPGSPTERRRAPVPLARAARPRGRRNGLGRARPAARSRRQGLTGAAQPAITAR